MLISEFAKPNYKRLRKALVYIKNNLIGSDSNMCLTIDYLTEINYMITGSNSIILRIGNLKPHDDENRRRCEICLLMMIK